MTTAAPPTPKPSDAKKQAQPAAKSESIAEVFHGEVLIQKIEVRSNIRKHFNPAQMKELAANIKKVGILEPLLCRFNGNKQGYILIAGERRLRAAKEAGLVNVPIRVLDVNDQQAAEIQAFENLHRADLSPIEEARAFKMLLDAGKYQVADLAARVDKSTVYVYRAVSLLELGADMIAAIEEGEMTPAHGHQIMRLPKDKRAAVIKKALTPKTDWISGRDEDGDDTQKSVKLGYMTAKELQVQIDSEIGTRLCKAQFDTAKPYAGEVACSACPLNAANQGTLFDGAGEERCLNRPCFDKKTEQFYKDLEAEGKKKWPELTFVGRGKQNAQGYARTIDGLPGNAMVLESEHGNAVIKKLLATRAHKLGYAVVLPGEFRWHPARRWKKAKLMLVVTDPPLIGGVRTEKIVDCTKPEKKAKKKSSSSPAEKPKDPKAEFIAAKIQSALAKAVAARALTLKLTLDDWRETAGIMSDDTDAAIVCAVLGKDGDSYANSEMQKVNEDQARALVLLGTRLGWNSDENDYKQLGVDVAGVKKKAAAEAMSEWDKTHPQTPKQLGKEAGDKAAAKIVANAKK
jgi:ParB/RepB/Spo0J family partition protein